MNPYIVLKSVVALFSLWYCIYYLWRDYRLDVFREDLFTIRDRMFFYAAQRNIPFDDPAYTMLRTRINAMIRFGHWFTMTRIVVVAATHRGIESEVAARWKAGLKRFPPDVQETMEGFQRCVMVAVLQHLVYQSFLRYIVIRPLVLLKNPFHSAEVVDQPKVIRTVERLESDAVEQEEEERPEPAIA